MDKKTVGVRYCGGCNPRFDRVGFVKKLVEEFPELEFVNAQRSVEYDAVIAVCGCLAQCADTSGLIGRHGIATVGGTDHFEQARSLLTKVKESF